MNNKMFEDFYGKNNTLEVCMILFDKCNLNCEFCFEEHDHLCSSQEILDMTDSMLNQLNVVIAEKPWLNDFISKDVKSNKKLG